MTGRINPVHGFLALVVLLGLQTSPAAAQVRKSDAVVKVKAEADRPGADGEQVVTVTLNIDKGWHVYANPVGNQDLADAQTTIAVTGNAKPRTVQLDYPKGKVIEDKVVGDYKVYEGKVAIKARVQRAKDDTGPLQLTVKFQACNDRQCLLPAAVAVEVP